MDYILFSLVIHMLKPDGGTVEERYPIEAPICEVIDGKRQEDSSCGIRYCLRKGRERAAVLWGTYPGSNFMQMCFNDNGEAAKEGTAAGGGHPALNFEGGKEGSEQ